MPGPYILNPTPDWLKPENASVTDTALTKAMRMIGHLIGADNPTAQVLGLMMTDVPGGSATGGLAKAVEGLKARVIKAYHGSPHDFERFSLEKIGTGEGAQAYGHGLYFAEHPEVAKNYRQAGDGLLRRHGQDFTPAELAVQLSQERGVSATPDFVGGLEDAIAEFGSGGGRPLTHMPPSGYGSAQRFAGYRHAMKNLQDVTVAPGKMYEVAIHADPEDFLDWDKPLSQQSEKVKQRLSDEYGQNWYQSKSDSGWTGEQLGRYLKVTESPGQASYLRDKGIPGIKYLDQGSRAAGEGSRNYVVFDDRLIDILKKYGLLLPAAGGAGQATISRRSE